MIQNAIYIPTSSIAPQVPTPQTTVRTAATPAEATESFASFLKTALDSVAAQEQQVHRVNDQFLIGEADVNDVLIASTKAELSLSLTAQVRNKVIEAYQEIMRMQI